jgi:hypothetical protein
MLNKNGFQKTDALALFSLSLSLFSSLWGHWFSLFSSFPYTFLYSLNKFTVNFININVFVIYMLVPAGHQLMHYSMVYFFIFITCLEFLTDILKSGSRKQMGTFDLCSNTILNLLFGLG